MFTYRKQGGITFLGLGQLSISFCVSRKRVAIFHPGDVAKIAAIYLGVMLPLIILI